MARTKLGLTLVLLTMLSGCSLIVREVTLPTCVSDEDCEVLNRTPGDKLITSCMRFQCSGDGTGLSTCVYRAVDADDDGHVTSRCPNGDDCNDNREDPNARNIFEGNLEICDGVDNDCDLVIDDGDFTGAGPDQVLDVTGAQDVTWGTHGSGTYTTATGTFAFALDGEAVRVPAGAIRSRSNPPESWTSLSTTVSPAPGCITRDTNWLATPACTADTECPQPVCNRIPRPADGGLWPLGDCEAVDGGFATDCRSDSDCAWPCASDRCVPPARDDVHATTTCSLIDLATSPIGSEGSFAVGLELPGCAAGRLRAGWLDSSRTELSMFGPEARSNLWFGIDVGAVQTFTDAGVPTGLLACTGADRASGTYGAARPAVAALGPETSPQALTVYLGDTHLRSRCGDDVAVPVEGLGLLRESGRGIAAWVTGSNNGHPQTFGETYGGGAPAVTAVAELGWIVGYSEAAPSGGTPIALHFVGRVAPPAAFNEQLPDGGGNAPAYLRRETEALAISAPFIELPAIGRADYVKIAVGALRSTGYDIGVTWMEGCEGEGTQSVWFSLVRFNPDVPDATLATPPVEVSSSLFVGGIPAIVYAGDGKLVWTSWSREVGGMPIQDDARGGFVVAWAGVGTLDARPTVRGIRLSELDGLPVDVAPLILAGPMSDAASVTLYPSPTPASTVSYGFWDRQTEIHGGRLICPGL